jgi:pimeloyl-ACP methyl ester carboxylesterase
MSDRASPETYTFERLADDVDELREHLGAERVSVLAHSLGGLVALHYAIRHASHCRSLALMSCSPAGTMRRTAMPTLKALGAMRIARIVARGIWYLAAWSWRRESDAKTASRYSMMHIMQEGNPAFREAVAAREIFAQNDNAPTLERAAFQTDLCDELPSIDSPVLVIHGSKDAPFVAGGQLLERGVRNVRRIELRGVGHHALVEENARTSRELIEFLTATADRR